MELLYFLSVILVIWFIKIIWERIVSVYEMEEEDKDISQEEWKPKQDNKIDLTSPQN